jgi:integrase/recombinase XerD
MALSLWTDFFAELQHVRGRSLNTVLAYRRDLELFDLFTQKYSQLDFDLLYPFMIKHGLSARSQARVISSIRTYYRFLEDRGQKIPDLRKLRPPKVKVQLPKAITLHEFQQLYHAAEVINDHNRTARNQITLLLLFGLGCRVSELIELNLADFSETDARLIVLGKGGKQRVLPLTEQILQDLTTYLQSFRPQIISEKTQSILINDRGNRPSRVDIWRWLSAWSKKAGFEKPISPHKFRHGCATQLLESGADLRSIQMLLGHSSIQTTQVYTSVTQKSMQQTIEQHHPLASVQKGLSSESC